MFGRVFPKLRNPADLSFEKSSAFPMTDSFTLCRYPIGPFDQHKSLCSVLHIVSGSVQIRTSFTFENPVSFCLIIRACLSSHVCSDRLFVYISQIRPSLSALLPFFCRNRILQFLLLFQITQYLSRIFIGIGFRPYFFYYPVFIDKISGPDHPERNLSVQLLFSPNVILLYCFQFRVGKKRKRQRILFCEFKMRSYAC